MIELKHICKTFDSGGGEVEALKDVSLTIEKGEIYGIIGMSGAGKSTLVRCINMLERPTAGSVVIDGKDLTKMTEKELRAERQSITMIFQGFNLLMQRTCLKNVCFPMELSGVPRVQAEKKAQELLELGLSVPQVTKIFLKLREMGVDVPADVYTIPYAVKMILEAKRRREAGESLVLPREAKKEGGAAGC